MTRKLSITPASAAMSEMSFVEMVTWVCIPLSPNMPAYLLERNAQISDSFLRAALGEILRLRPEFARLVPEPEADVNS